MSLKALGCLPPVLSRLMTVGEDVLYHIIRFLHVRDVVLLQRTNRYMNNLTSSRATWLNALRDQCIENDIPLCTYSWDEMDTYQLKQATIRPYLFLKMIEQPEGVLCETEEETLDLHIPVSDPSVMFDDYGDEDEWQDYTINDLKVIPGGRFLITCCEKGYIRCWDLDKRSSDGKLHHVASIHTGAIAEIMIIQRSVESASKFVILVHPRHPE
ncbi:uncharacterized protein EI90DRAFT_632255 [Cantharellus anzutake]|uniref:uncharacterized protein n=1 Tax=Cantharellus anzutake TaxID=1750568 RepID=UPI00190729BF|nr:uncharacterized protein EI90DRAFT_632255 [Cantharellus anzutake]KAF8333130.1 hypothetical protein EI90DRAFT_632255 [Cantharellus anzutake]